VTGHASAIRGRAIVAQVMDLSSRIRELEVMLEEKQTWVQALPLGQPGTGLLGVCCWGPW
jgi:hypothetical protein